jgi:hypothetical protein
MALGAIPAQLAAATLGAESPTFRFSEGYSLPTCLGLGLGLSVPTPRAHRVPTRAHDALTRMAGRRHGSGDASPERRRGYVSTHERPVRFTHIPAPRLPQRDHGLAEDRVELPIPARDPTIIVISTSSWRRLHHLLLVVDHSCGPRRPPRQLPWSGSRLGSELPQGCQRPCWSAPSSVLRHV